MNGFFNLNGTKGSWVSFRQKLSFHCTVRNVTVKHQIIKRWRKTKADGKRLRQRTLCSSAWIKSKRKYPLTPSCYPHLLLRYAALKETSFQSKSPGELIKPCNSCFLYNHSFLFSVLLRNAFKRQFWAFWFIMWQQKVSRNIHILDYF